MVRYLAYRVAGVIPIIFGVTLIVFVAGPGRFRAGGPPAGSCGG